MVLKDTLATLRGIYEKWQYKIVPYFSDIFDQKEKNLVLTVHLPILLPCEVLHQIQAGSVQSFCRLLGKFCN